MTSIFPDQSKGGLIVWDVDTGLPVTQPDVQNVSIPDGLTFDCDVTAQPDGCRTPVPQEQVNAIVSELLHLFNAMDPELIWNCSTLGNLSAAFINFVASLAGSGGGTPVCAAGDGDGSEANAKLVYCNGNTVKLWTIHGEDGLIESIQQAFCDGVNGYPDNNLDTLLYCRQGVVRTTYAADFNNFQGTWAQARAYATRQMVMRNGRLYMPNATIPAGTAFVIGTTGATWFEVSSSGIGIAWELGNAYQINTIVSYQGNLYAANANIPANTPFVAGTSGQTWRKINFSQAFILDFDQTTPYEQYQVVTVNDLLYRANGPVAAGVFQPAQWTLIGGEKNLYRGPWDQTQAYALNQMVQRDGLLYSPNAIIPAGTGFAVGSTGTTWYEVSPSVSYAWVSTQSYLQDSIVSYQGNWYAANEDLPSGLPPSGTNVGVSGQTWRLLSFTGQLILPNFSATKDYAARELVAYRINSGDLRTGIWRAKSGGHPLGPWDFDNWELLGERNYYRGDWNNSDYYVPGDMVTNPNASDAEGFYRLNWLSDSGPGLGFTEGTTPNTWRPIGANSSWQGEFDPTKSYRGGDYVATPNGIYKANGTQSPAAEIVLGTLLWQQTNRHRGVQHIAQDLTAGADHVGYYLRFESANPKTLTLSKNVFEIGDVLFGISTGGQLTFAPGSGDVVINTPDSLNLREVNGATFAVTYIGLINDGTTNTYQFDIAGDLAPA